VKAALITGSPPRVMKMGKVRRCDKRCHQAKGSRCGCWCAGFFHGADGAGAINRAALTGGTIELVRFPGYREGQTQYIEQKQLPISD
jgi:hypothetical protein